jgi:hypothetical protein
MEIKPVRIILFLIVAGLMFLLSKPDTPQVPQQNQERDWNALARQAERERAEIERAEQPSFGRRVDDVFHHGRKAFLPTQNEQQFNHAHARDWVLHDQIDESRTKAACDVFARAAHCRIENERSADTVWFVRAA